MDQHGPFSLNMTSLLNDLGSVTAAGIILGTFEVINEIRTKITKVMVIMMMVIIIKLYIYVI